MKAQWRKQKENIEKEKIYVFRVTECSRKEEGAERGEAGGRQRRGHWLAELGNPGVEVAGRLRVGAWFCKDTGESINQAEL